LEGFNKLIFITMMKKMNINQNKSLCQKNYWREFRLHVVI